MSLRRFPPTNRNSEVYTSNDTTVPTHNLSGRDPESERPLEYSNTDTLGAVGASQATPNSSYSKRPSENQPPFLIYVNSLLVYYRIYAEDGALPTNTAVAPSDPFLGRIKVRSVPPPRTAKIVKRYIAKLENIKDRGSTSLFLTSYSKSPIDDAEKIITNLNGTGPGSTPQESLALVAKMSDPERSALESDGRVGLESAAEPDTTPPGIRYGTSNQQSPFILVTLNGWEKCTINSMPMILKFYRK